MSSHQMNPLMAKLKVSEYLDFQKERKECLKPWLLVEEAVKNSVNYCLF
jgi:hypothetical protein